jgi:hypothetical protein
MTVTVSPSGTIELSGACPVEDAEVLLQHLSSAPGATVDWTACESAHTAVIQVMLVARVRPVGPPLGRFLREQVDSLLDRVM